ncbi:MAG: methyltransferase domain-containing protein, partial [Erysipelotrichaceae bacterium]
NNVPLNMARINRLVANEAQIQALGFHHVGDDCYTYEGAIAPTSAFQEGLVTIQDYASQKVAPFLNPQKGEMVLDACAAPGTKSVHMAQLMENTGKIVALDLHPHRVQLIQNSLNRLHVENVSSMAADATQLHLLYQTPVFDKILVDAPCTGYGVMKRKSDIKVHLKPEDMDEIIKIQAKILHSAAFVLKPGGVMVYSTCTLNKKENEQQVQKFLDSHQQFVLVEEQTIFPYEHECDGFYMAKILKKPNQE